MSRSCKWVKNLSTIGVYDREMIVVIVGIDWNTTWDTYLRGGATGC